MTYRFSTTTPRAQRAPSRFERRRIAFAREGGWAIRRIRRSWFSPLSIPMMEEVEERRRTYRGFFASLTAEQRAVIGAYDGPEVLGNPNGPRRTY